MKENYNKMYNEGKEKLVPETFVNGGKSRGLKASQPPIEEVAPDKESGVPKEPRKYKVVRCTHLNLREKPSKDSDIICTIKAGEIIQVEMISDGWAHVYTSAGAEGYVVEEFIKEV